jgi:DNA repair protein RecO (recombination protein O)
MAEIIKVEAIVLRKTNFKDSSLIVQFYTKDYGKISALLKGARSSKSKIGSKVDVLNHTEIVLYKKEERELHLVTQANLKNHFPTIKEDLDRLKYASAVCELILNLIPEGENNEKIFRGVIKIISLMNKKESNPQILFARFFIFFIKEIGYEISTEKCVSCGNPFENSKHNAFNYAEGIICRNCYNEQILAYKLSAELFDLFNCLSTRKKINTENKKNIDSVIFILEKFLTYHIPEFKGIRTLKLL